MRATNREKKIPNLDAQLIRDCCHRDYLPHNLTEQSLLNKLFIPQTCRQDLTPPIMGITGFFDWLEENGTKTRVRGGSAVEQHPKGKTIGIDCSSYINHDYSATRFWPNATEEQKRLHPVWMMFCRYVVRINMLRTVWERNSWGSGWSVSLGRGDWDVGLGCPRAT